MLLHWLLRLSSRHFKSIKIIDIRRNSWHFRLEYYLKMATMNVRVISRVLVTWESVWTHGRFVIASAFVVACEGGFDLLFVDIFLIRSVTGIYLRILACVRRCFSWLLSGRNVRLGFLENRTLSTRNYQGGSEPSLDFHHGKNPYFDWIVFGRNRNGFRGEQSSFKRNLDYLSSCWVAAAMSPFD